jgi:hypothetical protein
MIYAFFFQRSCDIIIIIKAPLAAKSQSSKSDWQSMNPGVSFQMIIFRWYEFRSFMCRSTSSNTPRRLICPTRRNNTPIILFTTHHSYDSIKLDSCNTNSSGTHAWKPSCHGILYIVKRKHFTRSFRAIKVYRISILVVWTVASVGACTCSDTRI